MALSYTEQLDTLYTTTWQLRRKEIVDQIFNATPFWYLLTKKGKRRTESGGRWIEVPLQYAKQIFGVVKSDYIGEYPEMGNTEGRLKGEPTMNAELRNPLALLSYVRWFLQGTIGSVNHYSRRQLLEKMKFVVELIESNMPIEPVETTRQTPGNIGDDIVRAA